MSRILGERCSSYANATAIGVVSKRAATLDNVSDCNGEKPSCRLHLPECHLLEHQAAGISVDNY
jgi:hypothetical protein